MAGRKLTDQEALDRLARASLVLGDEPGQTVRANTALEAARQAVSILIIGLEIAGEEETDTVPGIISPR